MIKFGPAGLGSVKDAVERLEEYKKLGLKACEIAFTYGVYIKNKDDAVRIGKAAKKLGISLTIHAPYWINLNSYDKKKIQQSKQRILDCLKVGTWLKARIVVFHPGYYGKMEKQETYENIKKQIQEMQKIRKAKKYTPKLAPETTGKVNVFGSIEEIARLVKETGCSFCIDFAHILAREKSYCFDKVKKAFRKYKEWHVHFSGIEYGEKGERHHKTTSEKELKKLLKDLPKNKSITVINEAPNPILDSAKGLKLYKGSGSK
ncbi:TIM barrel protein [Candidatus Woesearchaeota archaeon]|nr:TIM barrel protein [Candidatus Woesearchaeota archaeon]